jgi:hypothetical protein
LEADPKDHRKAVQASSEEAASQIGPIRYQKWICRETGVIADNS